MSRSPLPAGQAGRRDRVRDEHMYRVDEPGVRATFRLQVFIGPTGLRPVVVATQTTDERGISLVNGCEDIVGLVWRDQFPDDPQPPLCVIRIIVDDELPDRSTMGGWLFVRFQAGPDRALSEPDWEPVTQRQLDRFVGGEVDADRGAGYVPPDPEPEYRVRYELIPMDQVPLETPFRVPCMGGEPAPPEPPIPWWQQLLDRLRGREQVRRFDVEDACCWYHGGDWRLVVTAAARLIKQAEHAGDVEDDLRHRVLAAAKAEGLSPWSLTALDSLISDPIMLARADGEFVDFTNGQHRTRAMRDAGLDAVLIGVDDVADVDQDDTDA